ncbi:MAG TPA: BadF/BadG/BcrA/BcrD ATPase family protein [Gaiellaceae bacterium]|nr:BadF/BadG/BcrA/BcrD ATPase family protein [Gaiellaceae bacterium]
MSDVVLAVDGGNSKTDLALVRADGELLALTRGPMSSPQHLGLEGSLEVLERLLAEAAEEAGLRGNGAVAEVAELLMAGVDFPAEEEELRDAVAGRGWARRTSVGNDTFAVLRAGTERGWGVAVVCGAGINCVGVAPDGRHARFPALGEITGDWGGGYDVGIAAASAAARSEDGRGPKTSLERAVPAYFGLETPTELAEAVHRQRIPLRRVAELPPVVFAEAAHDPVAAAIVHRLAGEVAALARVALERLGLEQEPTEVLLGGGLLRSGDGRLTAAIEAELRGIAPALRVRTARSAPIVGAALLGLDELGASEDVQKRVRRELGAAVERLEERRGRADG